MKDLLNYIENNTTGLDSEPDSRDIIWEELSTAGKLEIKLPEKVLLNDGSILNQGHTMLCVAYGTTNGVNEGLNFYGFKPDKEPNILAGYIRKYLDPLIDKKGTYIVYGPKGAEKLDWIDSYTQINTLEGIKQSLYLGLPIATGTNKLSWIKTSKNAVAVLGKGGGHFMSIVGYDDNLEKEDGFGKKYKGFLIIENTWGEKWGDKGRYYLPYELVDKVLYKTKKNLIVSKEKSRKLLNKIIDEINEKKKKIKVKPKIKKQFEYFNEDFYLLKTENEKNLFQVLQNLLKETGYKPIYRTIIGETSEETIARILDEIHGIRLRQKINKK